MTKTKYKRFEDLEFHSNWVGEGARIMFDNGYGASVIRGQHTYGGSSGLYEIAVLDSNGRIAYNTPITNDVIGYLSEKDVTKVLINIQKLK